MAPPSDHEEASPIDPADASTPKLGAESVEAAAEPTPEPAPEPEGLTPLALLRQMGAERLPVEGLVVAQRGTLGLDVQLDGGILALCLMADVDLRHSENPGHLVGQRLKFLVKEVGDRGPLLSQRALLAVESDARVAETRGRAVKGAILRGKVISLREFGAFVDIGGLEGLIHVSELSRERGTDPKELLAVGEEVEVEVLKIKHDPIKGDRFSLRLRSREPSLWDKSVEALVLGQQLAGKVVRLQPFGAFVELAPGLQGLVHLSALSPKKIHSPSEVVLEGQEIAVELLEIDRERRRLSLRRLPSETEAREAEVEKEARRAKNKEKREQAKEAREKAKLRPHERHAVGEVVEVTVDRIEPYGLFVKIGGGGRGMIHVSELGTPKGTEPSKELPPGSKFKAVILEIAVDPTPRIRLSRAAVERIEAGDTVAAYLTSRALLAASERAPAPRRGRDATKGPPSEARPMPEGAPRERRPRSERPERPERGGPRAQPAAPTKGLGTLGDLFKAKLEARKK